MGYTFIQIADASYTFWIIGPKGWRCPCGNPWTRAPAQTFFLFLKMTHQKTWFTQAGLAHLWQSQTEFKWPHLQAVPGFQPMHVHIQKFNTNVQIIKGHFYTPSTIHNGTPAHYSFIIPGFKEFPEFLSCPSLVRTHTSPGLSSTQGCWSHDINTVNLPRALIFTLRLGLLGNNRNTCRL